MSASVLYFLIAAVIAVPLFRSLRLGAILGYLCAGMLIGPSGLHLISETQDLLHFSEIGVVLLLFVIGLELNPEKLWKMRGHITLVGGGQMLLSALAIGAVFYSVSSMISQSIVIGLALALSSTAFAVQLMVEKGVLGSPSGRLGFAILLMQDLAVIPVLLVVSYLAPTTTGEMMSPWVSLTAVVILLAIGRYAINPILDLIARFGSYETMTATALLIVLGAAFLMDGAGLSMGLGAFMAGVLLANSRYRHQLETDIKPFKGLTLGLFFIAIGMSFNVDLLVSEPLPLIALALALMLAKATLVTLLLMLAKQPWRKALPIALMLSQGGEFAFVIMTEASGSGLVPIGLAEKVNLVVGLSMMLTVPLVSLLPLLNRRQVTTNQEGPVNVSSTDVLILGFGRFGQMTGRILSANHIPFTAIEQDPEHIKFVRQFGNTVYFGDATRLDLLHNAGIGSAQAVIVAIDNAEAATEVVKLIRMNFSKVKIIARARNRMHYLKLKAAGADVMIREIYDGSLTAAEEALSAIGYSTGQAIKAIELFRKHDSDLLERAAEHYHDPEKVLQIGLEGRKELEQLFNDDIDSQR